MSAMKRNRRTRILVNGAAKLRSSMAAAIIASNTVLEIEPPTEGLVMLTVRETARGSLFHLGELLVTESKARIGQTLGLGIVAGSNPKAAWELAVIDAAFNAALPQTEGWERAAAAGRGEAESGAGAGRRADPADTGGLPEHGADIDHAIRFRAGHAKAVSEDPHRDVIPRQGGRSRPGGCEDRNGIRRQQRPPRLCHRAAGCGGHVLHVAAGARSTSG